MAETQETVFAEGFVTRELFGGAMSADLPIDYVDVSNIRPVPSHQEIYLSATGFDSVCIDINERVTTTTSDIDAARLHFSDIVTQGDHSEICHVQERTGTLEHFPMNPPIIGLGAYVSASAQSRPTTIVLLVLIRLVPQATDLVLTLNIPLHAAATSDFSASASAPSPPSSSNEGDLPSTISNGLGVAHTNGVLPTSANNGIPDSSNSRYTGGIELSIVEPAMIARGELILQTVLKSLRIIDWSLFQGVAMGTEGI